MFSNKLYQEVDNELFIYLVVKNVYATVSGCLQDDGGLLVNDSESWVFAWT